MPVLTSGTAGQGAYSRSVRAFFFFMKTAAAGIKVDESSEAEPYGKCAV